MEKEYVDLLIVDVGRQLGESELYVVETPSHEAYEGDLVEFEVADRTVLGTVIDKMWCGKGENAHRCIGYLNPILPAKKIYKAMWTKESAQNQ